MKIMRENVSYYEEEVPNSLNGFRNWEFSSGSTTGEDFKVFARKFKKFIKDHLPQKSELVSFLVGHYFISGFIQKDSKFVYFSISDVRHFPGQWENNVLIRTAKSEKDYTGGSNNYTGLLNFTSAVEKLFQ